MADARLKDHWQFQGQSYVLLDAAHYGFEAETW
jgi:hypothetical protein